MAFTQPLPIIYCWLIFASLVMNLALGGLVFADSPRRTINRIFGLLCLMLTGWGAGFLGLLYVQSPRIALAWSRLYLCSLMMIPPLFYHLILGSMGKETIKNVTRDYADTFERVKRIAYVFGVGGVLLITTNILPQHVVREQGVYFPQSGGDCGGRCWSTARSPCWDYLSSSANT